MGQNTVRRKLNESKFVSILLWFLVLSWAGFLAFSNIIDQMYWYDSYSRIDTFIVREKSTVPDLSGSQTDNYLVLEDRSGRMITISGVTPTYWNSISINEIMRVKIKEYYISNIKHTSFQICVMWYSFILPFLISLIGFKYDRKNKLIYGTKYFYIVAVIYLIIGFIVTASLW